jgi:hypothetical protein
MLKRSGKSAGQIERELGITPGLIAKAIALKIAIARMVRKPICYLLSILVLSFSRDCVTFNIKKNHLGNNSVPDG